jgi:hypothetical protein
MAYPGILTRGEFATGLITRGIKINGNYLLVDQCNINQNQQIGTNEKLLQGGPGSSISDIGAKKIIGNISFPIRVNADGDLETPVIDILNHAQSPVSALTMDTNHVLIHTDLTSEDGGTNNNELLKLNTMVISSLTLQCSTDNNLSCTVNFEGMIDTVEVSDYAVPDTTESLGRAITWGDCDISREESSMRTVNSFEVTITNSIETPTFLIPYQTPESGIASTRSDQIQLIGLTAVKWTGSVTELVRSGADLNTFIHGGWMVNENLVLNMGPITATFPIPLFEIATMPFTASVLTRSTKWTSLIRPRRPLTTGGLFTFV